MIIAEAERIARDEWGVGEMHMTVISVREDLIAWYERRGYRRTGQMTPFPYGDERFGLPQRDDLAVRAAGQAAGLTGCPQAADGSAAGGRQRPPRLRAASPPR